MNRYAKRQYHAVCKRQRTHPGAQGNRFATRPVHLNASKKSASRAGRAWAILLQWLTIYIEIKRPWHLIGLTLCIILPRCALSLGTNATCPVTLQPPSPVLIVRHNHHRNGYRAIRPASCHVSLWNKGYDTNAQACETVLLDKAHKNGATMVVVNYTEVDFDSATMHAILYGPQGR